MVLISKSALKKNFTLASGNTTVPISLPSTTIDFLTASFFCCLNKKLLTDSNFATELTMSDISKLYISSPKIFPSNDKHLFPLLSIIQSKFKLSSLFIN